MRKGNLGTYDGNIAEQVEFHVRNHPTPTLYCHLAYMAFRMENRAAADRLDSRPLYTHPDRLLTTSGYCFQ